MDAVDAEAHREIVEVDVAGLGDGLVHVGDAVAGALPVAVAALVVGQHEPARAVARGSGGDHARLEARQRHEGLDGGARRIAPAQGAVEERAVRVVRQRAVGGRVDAVDEEVGVVARRAHERQHLARARVEGDDRAAGLAEGLLRGALQAQVDGQPQVAARARARALEHAQRPALGVDLDLLHAHAAVQERLVGALDAELADVAGATVLDRVERLEVVGVDARDVAEDVGEQRARRVVARRAHGDVHTRELVAVDREARRLRLAQPQPQGDGLEAGLARRQGPEALDVDGAQGHDAAEALEHGVEVRHLLRHHLEAVGGTVLGHGRAVAVEDQPARRRQRHEPHAVLARERAVALVLEHLELHQPRGHRADGEHGEGGGEGRAPREQALLGAVVLEVKAAHGLSSRGSACAARGGWRRPRATAACP